MSEKINFNTRAIFFAFLLLAFAFSKGFALVHVISHDGFKAMQMKVVEPKEKSSAGKKSADCFWCASASLQKHSANFFLPLITFAVFYFSFSWRVFDRVKTCYILSKRACRAPPAHS